MGVAIASGATGNITGTAVNTTGTGNAYGVYGEEGVLKIQDSTITTAAASAVYYTGKNAGSSLSITGANTQITATGADAVVIAGGKAATIGNGVKITAKSASKNGITVNGGGALTIGSATVLANGAGGIGLYATGAGSTITATGTRIQTTGATSAEAVSVSGGASVVLNNVNISTVSSNGHGVWLVGAGSSVQMNAATSISTTGKGAYGVLAESGATKTFTGGNSADALPGTMSIQGDGSAAFGTYGSNSKITFNGIDFATASNIMLGANASTVIAGNSGAVEFQGNTAATNTKLRAQGGGTLKFSGAATASGASITVDGGTSSFDATGITSGKDDFAIGTLSGNGQVNMGGTRLNLTGGDSTFSGVISGTNGLRYNGTGTLTLSGANTFTGNIGLISGTVSVSSDAALGGNGSGINFNGGTLKVTGNSFNSTTRSMAWNAGGGGFDIDSAGNTFTVSQNLGAGGALTKTGAGTLVLSGTNIYTGGTNINGGTLVAGANNNLGATSGGLNFNGGTLRLSSAFDNARAVTLGAGGGTIETAAGNSTFSGTITGAGALTKRGAGTMILTGADTATGSTSITAGVLQIGNGGTTGSIIGNIVNSASLVFNRSNDLTYAGVISGGGTLTKSGAGTLTLTGDSIYTGATTISAGTLQVGSGGTTGWLASNAVTNNGTLSFNRSDNKTYAGNISGSGSVVKSGAGTLILSGTNTFAGGTTISGGTLQVASDDKLGASSGAVTLDGGTLNLAGTITSARAYHITSRNGTIDTGTNTDTLNGVIDGAGALTKVGGGTLVLTGANTYGGGTTISAGTLQLGSGGAAGSITGNVVNNGTLVFNRNDASTFSGVVSGTGILRQGGTGRTILTGANTYTGDTVIESGTLQVGADSASGAISGNVRNSGSLEFKRSDSYSYAGTITGTGSLKQTGAGTLILTGNNSYTGLTTIDSGTLQIGAGGASGSINSDIVNNAALVMNRSDDVSYDKKISGSGTFEKRGAGKLTVTGDNDYTGLTTISEGTLQIGNGTKGSINGNILNNSNLIVDRDHDIDFTNVLSGTGTLEKQGTGNLTLSGDNSGFTGATTVSAGGLMVDGTLGSGAVTVASGASLGGAGTIGGNTTINSGGTLVGTQGSTLNFGSDLTLASGSVLNVSYGAFDANAGTLFNVNGNLNFNANVVNVADLGGFGPGQYNLFHADGTITGALTPGTLPSGVNPGDVTFNRDQNGHDYYFTNTQGMQLGYWDGTVTSASGSLTGGDGIWEAGATNWTAENGGLHNIWNAAQFAIFSGQSGTVTVQGPVSTSGMQFVTTGYSVTGGPLTLESSSTAAPIIRVGSAGDATVTATVGSVLSGSKGMEKSDLGTLILTADNDYTGDTTIQAGTLQLGNGGTTGSVIGDIMIGKPDEDPDAVLAVDRSGNFTLGNRIDGRGKLVQRGAGDTTLTGSNNYSGGTDILAGRLIVSADNNLGNVAGAVTLDGGTLQFAEDISSTRGYTIGVNGGTIDTGAKTDTITGVIGGTGQFTKLGTGTLVLGGDNTFTGDLHVNAGTLQISDNSNLGNPHSHLYVNDATLRFGDTFTMTHDLTLGGAGATIDVDGYDNSISGVIDGGKLTKTGAGTLLLTGANTYTGDTEIDAGTLAVLEDANFGANASNRIIIGNATLRLDESFNTARNIDLTDANSTINVVDDGFNTLTGKLSGTGVLNKTGTGTLVLGGANGYQGGTDIQSGILQISDDGNLGDAAGAVAIAQGAELQFSQGVTSARDITLGATGSTINTMTGNSTLNGVIRGGELHKTGAGTLVLAGQNSYSSSFLDGGIVQVGNDYNLGQAGGAVIFNGGTLQFSADVSTTRAMTINEAGGVIDTQGQTATLNGRLSGAGELTKDGSGTLVLTDAGNSYSGNTLIRNGTLRLNGAGWITGDVTNLGIFEFANSGDHDFAGVISGTGSVLQSGAGTTTLSGHNAYSGGTSITAGALAISEDDNLGTGGLNIANNATLRLNNSFALNHAIELNGGGTIDTGANNNTLADVVSGTGALTKIGTGKLSLSGANSYNGGTVINGGILQIEADSNLGAANGAVTMADGTTLELTNDISMDRAFTLNGEATIQTDDGTSTISQVVGGNGGLTKAGEGTLVLEGVNTYKGDTSINNGVLRVDSDQNLGDTSGTLSFNGGELQVAGSDFNSTRSVVLQAGGGTIDSMLNIAEMSGSITGAGKLTKIGEGQLVLSGDNTYSGGTSIEQGALQIGGSDGLTGSITGNIENNGILVFSRDTLTYGGDIAGSGKLEQSGVGTTVLTGSVNLDGGTTIAEGGTLQIGDGTTNGSFKSNVVNDGTFAFNAFANTNIDFNNVLSGNGVLNQNGAGSATFTGDSSAFEGTTNVTAGSLYVNGTLGSAASTMTVTTNGTLAGGGTIGGDTTIAGTLKGQDGTTLTFLGGLTMQAGSTIDVAYGTRNPDGNGLFNVQGTLALQGSTVNITSFGGFGPGSYRLFDYQNTYSNTGSGLIIGTVPDGQSSDAYIVYDDDNKQINIMNTAGARLNIWQGGDGSWNQTGLNWHDENNPGVAGAWKNYEFAIFNAPVGTVAVDTGIQASGMAFQTDGYSLTGTNSITLAHDPNTPSTDRPIIRVGDATEDGRAMTATIAAPIGGTEGLQKTDYGTLVLTGANTYTGGTDVLNGTLELGDGGTIIETEGVSVDADGPEKATFAVNKTGTFSFGGVISGAGQFAQKGTGETILTANNSYSGGTSITAGTLSISAENNLGNINGQVAIDGGTLKYNQGFSSTRAIALGAGNGTIETDDTTNDTTINSGISGAGGLTKGGAGTLILAKDNTYVGDTTIAGGMLQLGNGGTTGKILGNVNTGGDASNKGTLVFDMSSNPNFSGTISGFGNVEQSGSDTLTLKGTNTYGGGTTINSGTLAVSADANMGNASGSLTIKNGTLQNTAQFTMDRDVVVGDAGATFQNDADLTLAGNMTGTTDWSKLGSGKLIINGNASTATGTASINDGYLQVNSELGGSVNLASTTAAVGGAGKIDGDVNVGSGTLRGQGGQTLTIGGNLTLAANSTTNVQWGSVSQQAAFHVDGNLTMDGTLNVGDTGGFGRGTYKLFTYDGTLTDNGLSFGDVPGGQATKDRMSVVTAYTGSVYIVNTSGAKVQFWNGEGTLADIGNHQIVGGDGTWAATAANWSDDQASVLAPFDDGSFAFFGGKKGNVTVDDTAGQINTAGMRFVVDGYVINGDSLNLTSTTGAPIIAVGDGTVDGAATTATIGSELTGNQGLNKTELGKLVLTGQNTYTGGTTVSNGILQLGDGTNSGDIEGDVIIANNVDGQGTLSFKQGSDYTFAGNITGGGKVTQDGANTTLTLSGGNSFSGGLTVNSGTVKAGSNNALGSGLLTVGNNGRVDLGNTSNTVGGLAGTGAINIGSGTFTVNETADSTYGGVLSGTGDFTKSGAADLTLAGSNQYTGATLVNQGTLIQGSQDAFSSASAYTTARNGTLDLGGYDTTVSSLDNGGTVNLSDLTAGTTLTVAGNYTGSNGTLVINTVLGDDNSRTDRLKVGGDTSGTTNLQVVNRGGIGGQTVNGIEVVDVAGQSNGTFSLVSDYTTKDNKKAIWAGAYAYTLQQGSGSGNKDGNWYLVSRYGDPDPVDPNKPTGPRYGAGVPVYQGYGENMQALNKLPTLQERVGNRYWTGENGDGQTNGAMVDGNGIWARIEGAYNRLEPQSVTGVKQDINTFIMQAGVDGQFYEDDNGKLVAGITGQYGTAHGSSSSFFGDGYTDTRAWSLGATATWYGNNGFYVDMQGQLTWFDNDLSSDDMNSSLASGAKAFGYAMSVEAGQRVAIDDHWSLTPQAQLMWSSLDADAFQDVMGNRVGLDNANSLTARLGLAASYRSDWTGEDGRMVNTSVYGVANLYQSFLGGMRINVAGVDIDTDTDKTWAGIGAGGSYAWEDQKYAVYGEGSINTSLNHFANSYALKGTVGFKVKW
ncbi:autotransporter-associated beta strand repeat-containing protein [Brucella tritici]|nr:autotransporter-associated beta strand repeat-containing protein [Brucella tritici]